MVAIISSGWKQNLPHHWTGYGLTDATREMFVQRGRDVARTGGSDEVMPDTTDIRPLDEKITALMAGKPPADYIDAGQYLLLAAKEIRRLHDVIERLHA